MQHHQIFPTSESISTPQTNLPCRILVVDDDPYICHVSADVLIRHGYEVNAAEDGAAGWRELQTCNYDLLITEHDLPKLTGLELIKRLRAARMALPVVLAAKRLPKRALARHRSLQLAATLVKPFAAEALARTVKIVLYATEPPSSPPEKFLAAGPSSSSSPVSRGVQPDPRSNWQYPRIDVAEALRPYATYRCWGIND